MSNNINKTGIWLIGALGDISTTLILGKLGIEKGITSNVGLVSETNPFNQLGLTKLDNIIVGGQDIRDTDLSQSVERLYRSSKTVSRELIDECEQDISEISQRFVVAPELAWQMTADAGIGLSLTEMVTQQRKVLRNFIESQDLSHLVVVNLTSAEPLPKPSAEINTLDGFEKLIAENQKACVAPSMLYAYCAFLENCSHVNFTPNLGASIPALSELSKKQQVPHCGNDGKTGETLVKTALAPMFTCRNLQVMTWQGYNMLGNGDGKTLSVPENRESKIDNKSTVLENMLGYTPHSDVAIDYVPSLGDWKTAWDLIHFKGFLDVPMTMQFTWQGCDSVLAAPLVLDMVRFCEFAARHGESGEMQHLASFFKKPLGTDEMALYSQFELLLKYAIGHLEKSGTHVKKVS
ncbi:MAG TPA: myo-inositol-1-phosphate synthase [Gammaproteobacteria bacterium]|nr:myo-inositol-1-phosphate synthase [Gammaproteobacteria bacterium]